MKRKITPAFLFLSTVMTGMTWAQTHAGADSQTNLNNLASGKSQVVGTFDNRYAGIKGSPYLSDDWLPGAVEIEEKWIEKVEVKVDLYGRQVLVKQGNRVYEFDLSPDYLKRVKIESDSGTIELRPIEFSDKKGRRQEGIFQILTEGPYSFLIRRSKEFRKADFSSSYKPPEYQDEFIDRTVNYIRTPQEIYFKYRRRKDLRQILDDDFAALVNLAGEGNLDLTRIADLNTGLKRLNTQL